jgi:thiamine-phosphate pyrophosphorylase
VDWIQIREKDLSARELTSLVRQAVNQAAASPTRIIVNDRLDIAVACGAGGVHLGGQSLPVKEVVSWCEGHFGKSVSGEKPFLVGASCHSMDEAAVAERDGADYIVFGPVFATPSKAQFGPPQGIEKLRAVCEQLRIPVLAIGGITLDTAASCIFAGAAGIAAIRLFQESNDPAEVVRSLRSKIHH